MVVITTESGTTLTATPHHILPVRVAAPSGQWFVYLMHRADRGYRIGVTKSMRSVDDGEALSILRVVDTQSEALTWESRFDARYGLRLFDTERDGGERPARRSHAPPRRSAASTAATGRRSTTRRRNVQRRARPSRSDRRVRRSSNRRTSRLRRRIATARSVRKGPSTTRDSRKALGRRARDGEASPARAGGLQLRRRIAWSTGEILDLMPISHPARHAGVRRRRHGRDRPLDRSRHRQASRLGAGLRPRGDSDAHLRRERHPRPQLVYAFRGADVRNILQFEDSFENVTTIVLDQNYRSTQVILDAANAVIANNVARKPKHLWSEPAAATASCATTPTTSTTRPRGSRAAIAAARRRRSSGGRSPSSTAPTHRPGRRGVAHPPRRAVQGGRRHPVLRPARDQGRDGVPAGGRQPGRRGQRQAGAQRAQARRRRHQRRQARRARGRPGRHVHRRDAPGRRGRCERSGHAGLEAFVALLDELGAMVAERPTTAR